MKEFLCGQTSTTTNLYGNANGTAGNVRFAAAWIKHGNLTNPLTHTALHILHLEM